MGEVIDMNKDRFGIYKFPWGVAIKDERRNRFVTLIVNGDTDNEINVEHLDVVLHENGIEFVT